MKQCIVLAIALVLGCMNSFGSTSTLLAPANASYLEGQYEEARDMYLNILETHRSSAVYYNLGNTYYRMQDTASARLHYERAVLLAPGDENIEHNILFLKQFSRDNVGIEFKSAFIDQFKSFAFMQPVDYWMWASIACAFVCFIAFGIRLWMHSKRWIFGTVGALGLLGMLFCTGLAFGQDYYYNTHDHAVIMVQEAEVMNGAGPDARASFNLHAGTKVHLIKQEGDKWRIDLPNGRSGWMNSADFEII